MATSKLTLEQQIENTKKRLAELEAKSKSGKFNEVLKKHESMLKTIYNDMKTASGKKRGVDDSILTQIADTMGMKGMVITKKVQQRKK
jgi:hypothetical protein